MKRTIFFITLFAGALLAGAACTSLSTDAPASDAASGERCSLSVSVGEPLTRSTTASSSTERAVSGVQVLVFDASGRLEAFGTGSSASASVTLSVTAGEKTVWAVANCPDDLSSVSSPTALSSKVTDLSSNGVSALLMAGSSSATVSSSSSSVTVPVSHLCSKVTLLKVTRSFETASLAAKAMTLDAVYLVNVAGSLTLGGGAVSGGSWYNRLGHKDGSLDALLYDQVGASLADGATRSITHTFYPYPNASTSESTSATWSERRTMLVLECTFDSQKCYYPIFIPVLERNKVCEFTSVTLTRRGSSSPYEPVSTGDVSVSITVTDFATGQSYTETI